MSVESINSSAAAPIQPSVSTRPNIDKEVTSELKSEKNISDGVEAVVDTDELTAAVDKLNSFVSNSTQRDLSFSIDKDTQNMVVTVRDKKTQDVIRQMPTEEALAVAKQIESMLGLILNDKA